MNKKETFYPGKIDGKRNDKLCSSELQDYRSLFESDNESTAESSSSDSQDEENGNDKWDLNDTIRESFAPTSSVVTNRCTNCGNNMHQQQTFCEKCGNTSKVVNVGGINTTSESKFVSHETIFGTDLRGTNIGSRTVSKIALSEIRCRNCEHIVNQDQIFCDKCGYQLKMECVGKTNGKPCAKLISSASKFCADCGTANLENKQVSTSTSVRNGCRSCGHDIHQDQMFCEKCGYKLKTVCIGTNNGKPCSKSISIESQFCENCEIENYSVTKKSPMKRCKRCGQDKYETQKFCDNCGYEIGGVCLGKINGNPCTKSINSVTRFCSDCGTTNPDYNIVYNKNHSKRAGEENYSVPSDHEVSIMRLVSMGFSREQAIESLQSTVSLE
ncbi:uncharacterized protein [Mytilus edulis]|uniref:uncharacterized protein n=1 Tax=Mytilus edulis TaxID=6550 RepID=UPI0039EE618B